MRKSEVTINIECVSVPSVPTALVVEEFNATSIIANWSSPANPNGNLLFYTVVVERETNGGFEMVDSRQEPAVDGVDFYSVSFDGLLAFSLYRVSVSAWTRIGEGEAAEGFVTTDPASASPPTDVLVETLNSTSIRVSWGYPEVPRGNIMGYNIFTNATGNGQLNITLQTVNDMGNQTHVFVGLLPFTYYQFRVEAFAVTPEMTHFGETSEIIIRHTDEDRKTHIFSLSFHFFQVAIYLYMDHNTNSFTSTSAFLPTMYTI